MSKMIAPLSGWMLDSVVVLDAHYLGFAASYLRASPERRQVIAAYLANTSSSDDHHTGVAAFLSKASHSAILRAAYGQVPRGLRGALGRSGGQPHDPKFYDVLYRLLKSPRHHRIVPTITQMIGVDLPRLRIANILPSEVCRPNVVDAVETVKAATDATKLLDLLVTNGVDRAALFEAVRRVTSGKELAELWTRWARRTKFGEHPIPASPCYVPVRNAAELRTLARRYRNCAERYTSTCLDALDAFAEMKLSNRALVVHLRRHDGMWMVEDLLGRHNSRPHPDLRAEALAYLRERGIQPKPKRKIEAGEWAVLHRLTSHSLFVIDEVD